jgi:RNA polymerase sigma factor (sigma-70 family)
MNFKAERQYEKLTDSEVWSQFCLGVESAFEYIYKTNFDRLYNYGCQFTADRSLVEDAIHELFIDLRRRRDHLSPTTKILPYLYSAFRRKIIRLRDKERRNQDFKENKCFEITLSVEDKIIRKDIEKEDLQKLQSAVACLTPRQREVIYYFYYENLGYAEIQEILGFEDIKSVRNLLYTILKSLRKKITNTLLLVIWLSSISTG